VRERVAAARATGDNDLMDPKLPPARASVARLVERLGGLPVVLGNEVAVVTDYTKSFEKLAEDIGSAQRFVHVQYYILAMDGSTEPVWRALEAAAARGVEVRVLFDHLGSRGYANHRRMKDRMDAAGIRWRPMLPVNPFQGRWARPDLRNHRKIVVIDGRIAWAGSQNLIGAYYGSSRNRQANARYEELVIRCEGPVALEFDAVFRTDWFAEDGQLVEREGIEPTSPGSVACQVLPSGPAHPYENNLRVFNAAIHAAQRRITLTNPYFVPDETLLQAVTVAAQRGVEVRLITDESGDHRLLNYAQRSYYDVLLEAGVRIFLHRGPTILHSKTLTIDDDFAIVGSSNLDMRSFHLNLEVSTLLFGAGLNQALRAAEDRYIAESRELEADEWDRRPWLGRVGESLARLTASLQ
jgi:cardiolipin synthase A/B